MTNIAISAKEKRKQYRNIPRQAIEGNTCRKDSVNNGK